MTDSAAAWQSAVESTNFVTEIENAKTPEDVWSLVSRMLLASGSPFYDTQTQAPWIHPRQIKTPPRVLIVGGVHTRGGTWSGGHVKSLLEKPPLGETPYTEKKFKFGIHFRENDPRMPMGSTTHLRLVPYDPENAWPDRKPAPYIVESLAAMLYYFIRAYRSIKVVVAGDYPSACALGYINELPSNPKDLKKVQERVNARNKRLQKTLRTINADDKQLPLALKLWDVHHKTFGQRRITLTSVASYFDAEKAFVNNTMDVVGPFMNFARGIPKIVNGPAHSSQVFFNAGASDKWTKLVDEYVWIAARPDVTSANRLLEKKSRFGVFYGPVTCNDFASKREKNSRVFGSDSWNIPEAALTLERLVPYIALMMISLATPGPKPRVIIGADDLYTAYYIYGCMMVYIDPRRTADDVCNDHLPVHTAVAEFRNQITPCIGEYFGDVPSRTTLTHGVVREQNGKRRVVGRFPSKEHADAFCVLEAARGTNGLAVYEADNLPVVEKNEESKFKIRLVR